MIVVIVVVVVVIVVMGEIGDNDGDEKLVMVMMGK